MSHARPNRDDARRGRATVLWGLGFFLALQACFEYPLSHFWPQLHDPEYGGKLVRLRAKLAAKPADQPLVLVLGSSHTGMGVRPAALPDSPGRPLVFNFSINGSGRIVDLLSLRRLLAEGIRPDWVLVETWPMHLLLDGRGAKTGGCLPPVRLRYRDLGVLARYYAQPHKTRARWREAQMLPWFHHRYFLVSLLAPQLLPKAMRMDFLWSNTDEWGWQWVPGHTECCDTNPARMAAVEQFYTELLPQFRITPEGEGALREIVETCRREGIQVAMLRMPESARVRRLYPDAVRGAVDDFLTGLAREYRVPLIDAWDWGQEQDFSDGHHLTPDGAARFMGRLDREVLRAIAAGRSLAAE